MKMNNKGFSLVELIVVIAIMAILVGVLAPSVTGQVDKSRKSKDDQNLDGLASAMATAITDDLVSSDSSIASCGGVFTVGTDTFDSATFGTKLGVTGCNWAVSTWQYLGGKSFKIESSAYKGGKVAVTVDDQFRVTIEVYDSSNAIQLTIQK